MTTLNVRELTLVLASLQTAERICRDVSTPSNGNPQLMIAAAAKAAELSALAVRLLKEGPDKR